MSFKSFTYDLQLKLSKLSFVTPNNFVNILYIEYGQSFKLELYVGAENSDIDQVLICFGGGEFLCLIRL